MRATGQTLLFYSAIDLVISAPNVQTRPLSTAKNNPLKLKTTLI